jgi:capsular exopolysaccharide synthesis family protein
MAEQEELVPAERRPPERAHRRLDSVIDSGPEGSEGYSYIRAYWLILWKRRWTILTVVLVLTTLVAIVSYKTQPVYEATARVEVEAETSQIQSLNDLYRGEPGFTDDTFLRTQVNILNSENLAWRTVQQLGLGEKAEFAPVGRGGQRLPVDSPTATQNRLIQAFRGHLRVQLVKDSRMIEVAFQSTDPRLAARAANALVNNYTDYNFHQKYDATRQASGFMEQQLEELKAKVEKSQQALIDYERKNLIVDIGDQQTVVEQRLAAMSQDLTSAQNERMQKQSLFELVTSNQADAALTQDELLQRLDEKYTDLREEYVDALGQYGPNFPKVKRVGEQLDELQSIMERERKRIVARIRSDYMAALGRERLLSAAVAHEKEEVGKLNQLMIEHNLLKREFETNQQLYASLLQHLKDATVAAGLRATNIHLVDSALVPAAPVRPRIMYNIEVSMLVGLVLGITLAFVMESMDTSIKSAEDVERVVAAPALAVIPLARLSQLGMGGDRGQPQDGGVVESIVLRQPTSSLAESFHTLRTAVLLSSAPHPPQALLVTSSQPGEGKTAISLNLALGLAQRGVPVVVVDTDMRRPGISRALALSENGAGLSSLLSGTHSLDEALRQFQPLPNLWVLPAGPKPPNPADLVSSPAMEKLLEELRGRFEHLVLDSAPLLLVTDPTILSRLVDGVVLVVESGVTARRGLLRAYKILQSAGGRILGTVVNKWDARREGYYAYYGSYYHSYYRSYYDGKRG